MSDASTMVAVDAAVQADASAQTAEEAAITAVTAAAVSAEVNAETVVTAAEAAVALAESQAALATQQAAQVIAGAEAAIVINEEKESWQDEAIRSLQQGQTAMSEALAAMGTDLMGIKQAIVELVSPQSTPVPPMEAGSIPTVTTQEVATETSSSTVTEPSPGSEGANRVAQVNADKRKRVLRFL
jgi:hypothetical protein